MKHDVVLRHQFVEFIPDRLEDGTLYVSMAFATATHRCCCGCGKEVVTPLSPTDWRLTFNGKTISLEPSVGNWGFPCQSHYWISENRAVWAPRMSTEAIDAGRSHDRMAKQMYYGEAAATSASPVPRKETTGHSGVWAKLKEWWRTL